MRAEPPTCGLLGARSLAAWLGLPRDRPRRARAALVRRAAATHRPRRRAPWPDPPARRGPEAAVARGVRPSAAARPRAAPLRRAPWAPRCPRPAADARARASPPVRRIPG